jgi:Sensors of blue-light using FAD
MALVSLVYVSSASREMSDGDLRAILESARSHNDEDKITGMLLYQDGYFIQALEGEDAAVESTYARIKQDARHSHVLLVYKNPIDKRAFEKWEMGFHKFESAQINEMPGFTDFLDAPFDPKFLTENPSRAKTLLEHFKEHTYF